MNYPHRVKILNHMRCSVCGRQSETHLVHLGSLCRSCFSRVIEKRIRKATRIKRIFKKDDNIMVFDELSFFIVNRIIKELPKKVFFYKRYVGIAQLDKRLIKDYIRKNKINKVIVPWSLDDEASQFLEKMLLNKRAKKIRHIKLFKGTTEEELGYFCRFNNLKRIKNNLSKGDKRSILIREFIDRTDKRYPGTKFKLLKSSRISELL